MKRIKKNRIGLRMCIVGVFFSVWLMAIGAKAVYLQVCQGDRLSQIASCQYEQSYQAEGKRGTIFDCKHREMAVSIDATSIGAYPPKVKNIQETSAALATVLKVNRQALAGKLSSKRPFVWIERQVTPKERAAVMELALWGIDFRAEPKRCYPNRTLAAQVIGFAGIDNRGLEGIEYHFDRELRGNPQRLTVLKDALGRGFAPEQMALNDNIGQDLILTIDRTIQYISEQALKEVVERTSAKSGMVLVMAPTTGAMLAIAHYPFFNPNAFQTYDQQVWRNRAITDPFEPGSTLKMFTAAAAIESGQVTANSIFFCENGSLTMDGHTIHDSHEHGWLSLQQIIKYSSNIGTIKVMEKIGPKTLYQTLRSFGFGEKTGIDCPGETAGSLAPVKQWMKMDARAISFGQGISVSAIQLISGVNAIANDGILMRPYVVEAIGAPSGHIVKRFEPKRVRRAVSAKTAQTVNRILRTVVTDGGTGENAALESYEVAGKTGTAQKTDEKGTYAKGKYIASFVGFVPADKPLLTLLVVVDEPQKEYYASQVAAPVFQKIAQKVLLYMNVQPGNMPSRLTVSRDSEVQG